MDGTFRPGIMLALADGARWVIHPGDAEAARIVSQLGAAMRLQPARGAGRDLLVVVAGGDADNVPKVSVPTSGQQPVVCVLAPPTNCDMLTIQLMYLSLAIAREAQSRGGVLLHGALAEAPSMHSATVGRVARSGSGGRIETQGASLAGPLGLDTLPAVATRPALQITGDGILLAGPGTVGKTTASQRLPPPWRSLCDDTTLVVRDATGQYWAHPWPTWSRFYSIGGVPGPGGSWDVGRAVPLRAIFFLSQSPDDRAVPLHVTPATAMLMETVQHVSRSMTRHLAEDETQALYQEQLAAVEFLARAIPAYTLHISLSGAFWEEIERVLSTDTGRSSASQEAHSAGRVGASGGYASERRIEAKQVAHEAAHLVSIRCATQPALTAPKPPPPDIESLLDDGTLSVVYTGPSMNPTLRQPDLLEVLPYEGRTVRRGDVVYFHPPGGERGVVHRVVRVTPQGVRTRGDNNSTDDPYLLQASDVIGQVVAAQRSSRRRRIAGGRRGVLVRYGARLWRVVNQGVSRLLHGAYRALAGTGRFRRLLPAGLRPRVFAFQARNQTFLKLLMGRRVVGQYDTREEQWRIQRPFRLFVDEAALPCPSIDRERDISRFLADNRSREKLADGSG